MITINSNILKYIKKIFKTLIQCIFNVYEDNSKNSENIHDRILLFRNSSLPHLICN